MSSSRSNHGYSTHDPLYVINVRIMQAYVHTKTNYSEGYLQDTNDMTLVPDVVQLVKLEALQDEIQQIDCFLWCL